MIQPPLTLYSPQKQRQDLYLESRRRGCGVLAACRAAGVSGSKTPCNWRKTVPGFAEAERDAVKASLQHVENKLWELCDKGNITAIIFFLTNRLPRKWKDRRAVKQEITMRNPDTGQIESEIKRLLGKGDSAKSG